MDNAKCNIPFIFEEEEEEEKKADVYTAVISPQTILLPVLSCMFFTFCLHTKIRKHYSNTHRMK
jgi:hypothetical protein